MKLTILISLITISVTTVFADTTANNTSQSEVVLGDMNDQSPDASKYTPKPQVVPKFIQEQNAISNAYEQEQINIEEEEEYYDDTMGMGMFGGPFFY